MLLHILSLLARTVEEVASATIKKRQMTVETEMKRNEIQLKCRQKETKHNRRYELKIAESIQ